MVCANFSTKLTKLKMKTTKLIIRSCKELGKCGKCAKIGPYCFETKLTKLKTEDDKNNIIPESKMICGTKGKI